MELHNLQPVKGSIKNRKRIGRGQGSSRGGTSTRGHKGAQSRSGYSKKLGFEGGQMPLQRRVPKFGFTNINRKSYKAVNISTLQYISDKLNISTIDIDILINSGIISKKENVKILGQGELNKKIEVKAHAFSKTAVQAIEKVKGVATTI